MSTVTDRLSQLGFHLPPAPTPLAAYAPAVRDGAYVWTSGQLPLVDGELERTGLVGQDLDADHASRLAATCALNALAAVAGVADLDAVEQVIKVVGYVASAPGFTGQPAVINGASELLLAAFGDAGRHARSALGVAALPLGAPVELELVCRVAS